MARAARMDDEPGAGQVLHQQADAAGVVEVDVGRDDVVDGVDVEPGAVERGEQARHRMVRAGIDERRPAVLDDQVGGVEARSMKAGVDDVDALVEPVDEVGREARGGKGIIHAERRVFGADARWCDSREPVASGDKRRESRMSSSMNIDRPGVVMMKSFEAALRLVRRLVARPATAACTLMRPPASLPPGTSIADARQTFGAGDEYPLPDGGTRLSFPRGKDTYMLDFDAGGRLVQSQQVLTRRTSRRSGRG